MVSRSPTSPTIDSVWIIRAIGLGFQIGSGTIESTIKQIAEKRLKVSGARWNLNSARLVAKARAAFLPGEWNTLATRREALGKVA